MVNKYQSDLPRNLCIHVQSVNPYVNADGRSPFDFRSSLSIDLYSLFFLSFFPLISSNVVYLIHQMYFCVEFRPSCACHLRAPLSFILLDHKPFLTCGLHSLWYTLSFSVMVNPKFDVVFSLVHATLWHTMLVYWSVSL